jgi:hypothetical protein
MSGLAVLPANCITTTTEPGASHGAELHHPGPRPGRPDRHPLATGQARLNRSAQLTDATDDMIVTKVQLSAKLAESYPQVRLLATDNTALRLQDGRGRSLSPGRRGTLSRSRSSSGQPFLLHRDQRQPGRVHCRRQLLIQRHAGLALHQSFLRTERGLRGQHRPGRNARHQPRRGADHRLRPVRRLRRHDAIPVRKTILPRHDRRPGLAAARLAAQSRQLLLFLSPAPASPPAGPPRLSQASPLIADMPVIASRPIGDQDLRGLRPGSGRPCPGCRHGLLPRTGCACAPIAYGVRRREDYESPIARTCRHGAKVSLSGRWRLSQWVMDCWASRLARLRRTPIPAWRGDLGCSPAGPPRIPRSGIAGGG